LVVASALVPGNKTFALSMLMLLVITLGGLVIAMLLPRQPTATPTAAPTTQRAGS